MSLCDPQRNGRTIVDYWQGASLRVKSYDKGCAKGEKREARVAVTRGGREVAVGVGG